MIQRMKELPGEEKLKLGLSMMDTGQKFVLASLGIKDWATATRQQKKTFFQRMYRRHLPLAMQEKFLATF